MAEEIAGYLRRIAEECTRLARDCPHAPTAHSLEGLGVELMTKAKELEEIFDK